MFFLQLPAENLLYLALYLVTLVLHVVAMNYVVGGAMVVAGAAAYKVFRNHCEATQAIVDVIKDWLPLALGVTITLGVAPILFVQILYKQAYYTSNLLLFHRWMAILPVLIVAFYLLYLQKSAWAERRGQVVRAAIALGVLAMFLFVAWSWSENHLLSLAGQQVWTEQYASGRLWYVTDELWPRLSLWMVGSLTTLSVIVAWQLRGVATTTAVQRLALIGLSGVVGSVLAGYWYWFYLPAAAIEAFQQPANQVVLIVAATGLTTTAAAWIQMARSGRLAARWLWLASVGLAAAIPSATLAREVRRYVGLTQVDQWQKAVEAASEAAQLQGFGVFLFFFVGNIIVIALLIRMIRRRLNDNAAAP